MGCGGGGTAEHFGLDRGVDVEMGTFSKTFATTGGFLAAKRDVVDYLRFFARSYMFSAHLPPPVVASVLAGISIIKQEPERRQALHESVRYLVDGLRQIGFDVSAQAAIVPVRLPPSVDIRMLNRRFHEENVFLNAIEYPAVSLEAQRLRISVTATHTREDLDHALAVFRKLAAEFELPT
jgi:glycine C-acetyltransferase